jgi:hypothetical protein
MIDYEVGYKKPPRRTQFQKGNRANPKGRGAAEPLRAGKIFAEVVEGSVEISEGDKKKCVTKVEFMIRRWAKEAAKGDIKSAELLLEIHHHSKTHGDYRHVPVAIKEWEKSGKYEITPDMSPIEAAEIYAAVLDKL